MSHGILFALIALIAWACDDFLIGRTSRKIGTLPALFFLSVFGLLVLTPFAVPLLSQALPLSTIGMGILLALMVVTNIAALADFEALRIGKLAAIDPLYGFEIPLTGLLAFLFLGDTLSTEQIVLIGVVLIGMLMVSTASLQSIRLLRWERGVAFALLSILFMGGTNFLTGYTARTYDPVLANWFSYLGLSIFCLILLAHSRQLTNLPRALRLYPGPILALGIADVIAWTSFAKSTTLIPIGIATAVSEAYIALAVLFGVYLNKEHLKIHQWLGIALIFACIALLALSIQ